MPAAYADLALAEKLSRGWFVSFDPGVKFPAIAIWLHGELIVASRVPVPQKLKKLDRLERARQIAELVVASVRRAIDAYVATSPRTLTFSKEIVGFFAEHPQWYNERAQQRMGKSPDPNKLAGMAVLDGAVAALLGVPSWSYLPAEWCSGLKKTEVGDPWACPRGRVVRSRLTAEEISRIVASHDSLDATGIGLKALGRLEPRLAGTT